MGNSTPSFNKRKFLTIAGGVAAVAATGLYYMRQQEEEGEDQGTAGVRIIRHTVRRDETLSKIAQKYATSVAAIMQRNHLTDADTINIGQILSIADLSRKRISQKSTTTRANTSSQNKTQKGWHDAIIISLKGGTPLTTHIGTFDLSQRFEKGREKNIPIITKEFHTYMSERDDKYSDSLLEQLLAYILATAQLETANFQTLKEWSDGERYNPPANVAKALGNEPGEGPKYIGRGYVQVTGENNYQNWSRMMFGDQFPNLLGDYRTALLEQPHIAARILVQGMMEGVFTGKGLPDYVRNGELNFVDARRVVNGTDKAAQIAKIAEQYMDQ